MALNDCWDAASAAAEAEGAGQGLATRPLFQVVNFEGAHLDVGGLIWSTRGSTLHTFCGIRWVASPVSRSVKYTKTAQVELKSGRVYQGLTQVHFLAQRYTRFAGYAGWRHPSVCQ